MMNIGTNFEYYRAGAAMAMMIRRNDDVDEEEIERIRQQREQRKEKNKIWRENKVTLIALYFF